MLKFQDGNIAVVKEDDVASRVGSSLSNVRDVIQVRMRKGEAVEILDSKESPGGKSQAWYKIAPPSGEFRWISEKYLSKEKPHDDLRGAGSDDSGPGQDSSATGPTGNRIRTHRRRAKRCHRGSSRPNWTGSTWNYR